MILRHGVVANPSRPRRQWPGALIPAPLASITRTCPGERLRPSSFLVESMSNRISNLTFSVSTSEFRLDHRHVVVYAADIPWATLSLVEARALWGFRAGG